MAELTSHGLHQSLDNRLEALVNVFRSRLGPRPIRDLWVAKAPGRVNLIGEHTDYNDGFVLPIAIERDVMMVGALRDDRQIRVYSQGFGQEVSFSLDQNSFDEVHHWSNYVRGVVSVLGEAGFPVQGADIALTGNVPKGAGLSSSAAVEVAAGMLLQGLNNLDIDPLDLVKMAQRAENEFVGVHCGIMDQFISRLGQPNHALLIDCRSLQYQQVPWPQEDVQLLVVDTRVERGLAGSAYNRRRAECEEGVAVLQKNLPRVRSLRDVSVDQFEEHAHNLEDTIRRRCTHVIYENHRTQEATKALAGGDWSRLGKLMNQSHESLRDLYEVSCKELDFVVSAARAVTGVYGARMTGAGFGGCAICLVQNEAVAELLQVLGSEYPKASGHEPGLLLTNAAAGARVWSLGSL